MIERKESDLGRTRDRLNQIERDMMALKEQNRQLKQEQEDRELLIDSLKKSENNTKGSLEQQISKYREQLSQERNARSEAEAQLGGLSEEFERLKEFGRAKLQGLEQEKQQALDQLEAVSNELENAQQQLLEYQSNQTEGQKLIGDKNQKIHEQEEEIKELRKKAQKGEELARIKAQQDINIQALQQEVEGLQLRNQELQDQNEAQTQAMIRNNEAQLNQLQSQLLSEKNNLIQKCDQLQQTLRETSFKHSQELSQIQQEQSILQNTYQELLSEHENIKNLNAQLQREKAEKERTLAILQGESSDQEQRLMKQMQESVGQLQGIIKNKENEIIQVKDTLTKANQSLILNLLNEAHTNSLKQQFHQEKQQLQQLCDTLQLELQSVSQQHSLDIQSLNLKLSQSHQQIQTLNESLERSNQHNQSLQRDNSELQRTITSLQGSSSEKERKLIEQMQEVIGAKDQETNQTREILEKIKREKDEHEKRVNIEISQLKEKIASKEAEMKQKINEGMAKDTMIQKMTEQFQSSQTNSQAERQQLIAQLNQLQQEKAALDSTNSTTTMKIEKKREKVKSMRAQLLSKQDESNQLKQQVTQVSSQLQAKIGDAMKEQLFKQQQQQQIQELQSLIQQIQLQKKERETELTALLQSKSDEFERFKTQSTAQASDQVKMLTNQLQSLSKEKEEAIALITRQSDQKNQELLSQMNSQVSSLKQEHEKEIGNINAKMSQVTQASQTKFDQINIMFNAQLKEKEDEIAALIKSKKEEIEKIKQLSHQSSNEQVKILTKQLEDLTNEKNEAISQAIKQSEQKHQDVLMQMTNKIQSMQQDHAKEISSLNAKFQQTTLASQQKSDQITIMFNTQLKEKEDQVADLQRQVEQRDKEIQDFFDNDYKQLQQQLDSANAKLKEQQKAQPKGGSSAIDDESMIKPLMEEIKKKNQLLMVKEAEVESLKLRCREQRETIEGNESSKELQEIKRQNSFILKEKEMKDVTIEQLKKDNQKQLEQIKTLSDKEISLTAVINALTIQNSDMISSVKAQPMQFQQAQPQPKQTPPQTVKKSPITQQQKPGGGPRHSLI